MKPEPTANILERLDGANETSRGQWEARCPAHDDRTASLCVGTGDDGRALVTCQAGCTIEAVCEAAGLTLADLYSERPAGGNGRARGKKPGRIVKVYDYTDEDGALLFQTVRFDPKDPADPLTQVLENDYPVESIVDPQTQE